MKRVLLCNNIFPQYFIKVYVNLNIFTRCFVQFPNLVTLNPIRNTLEDIYTKVDMNKELSEPMIRELVYSHNANLAGKFSL